MSDSTLDTSTQRPWWSYGHVWLVISGPLIVVVASLITFYMAAYGQDPVLMQSNVEPKSNPKALTTLAPAVQARNHAATGALPSTPSTAKP